MCVCNNAKQGETEQRDATATVNRGTYHLQAAPHRTAAFITTSTIINNQYALPRSSINTGTG